MTNPMILILGTTASGKGRMAFDLALRTGGEILSVDSMKVYRGMDIGTAKPDAAAQTVVRHHMIDVAAPWESFSAGRFVELARKAIDDTRRRGKPVIAVGGTALYIKALLYGLFEGPGADAEIRSRLNEQALAEGLQQLHRRLAQVDPASAERINVNDQRRIVRALEVYTLTGRPISQLQKQFDPESLLSDWKIIGIRRTKEDNNSRINLRVKKMIARGLVEEVRTLMDADKPMGKQAASAIGYAEIIEHLTGRMSLEDAIEKIKINTRRLAKAQRTWFKRFTGVNWVEAEGTAR